MKKYNILFIDEDTTQLKKFQRYARKYDPFDVIVIEPTETIEEIINIIVDEYISAVVCDFDLKEKQTTNYYGK